MPTKIFEKVILPFFFSRKNDFVIFVNIQDNTRSVKGLQQDESELYYTLFQDPVFIGSKLRGNNQGLLGIPHVDRSRLRIKDSRIMSECRPTPRKITHFLAANRF